LFDEAVHVWPDFDTEGTLGTAVGIGAGDASMDVEVETVVVTGAGVDAHTQRFHWNVGESQGQYCCPAAQGAQLASVTPTLALGPETHVVAVDAGNSVSVVDAGVDVDVAAVITGVETGVGTGAGTGVGAGAVGGEDPSLVLKTKHERNCSGDSPVHRP
jgi:hypothetical protein